MTICRPKCRMRRQPEGAFYASDSLVLACEPTDSRRGADLSLACQVQTRPYDLSAALRRTGATDTGVPHKYIASADNAFKWNNTASYT
jgi:hypothetical protein